MSIINMKRVSVIGMDSDKEKVVKDLMELGVIQLSSETVETNPLDFSRELSQDGVMENLEAQIADVTLALETLEQYSPEKEPLFITRRTMRRDDFDRTIQSRDAIMGNVRGVLQLREKLHKITEARNKRVNDLSAVRPWIVYDLPLNLTETLYTDIDIGTVPATVDIKKLCEKAKEVEEAIAIKEINRDKDFIYLVVDIIKGATEEVMTVLKQYGYSSTVFKGFKGTALEYQSEIEKDIALREREIREAQGMIGGRFHEKKAIECLYDQLIMDKDRQQAKESLGTTKKTFNFEGWMPEYAVEKVSKILDRHQCYYEIRDPREDEEVPVLIKNGSFATPFESVTEMYSLPDYRGFDPTKLFSIFYAAFFGIMLSDAGYGLIITLGTFWILKKYDLEGMTRKTIKMFFYCGIATIFWGALFGGWFGDLIQTFARVGFGADITIRPLWFDPIKDPMKLLVFSLALGVIHIFLGMGIKAYMLIKKGKWLDAAFDVFSWYLVIGGAIAYVITKNSIAGYISIFGLAVVLLTGGRDKKGFGKVIGGLGSVYGVTGYVSDILSYSRLLALGLATGVIAQVVNTMGALAGRGVVGVIVLIIVAVFGHVFNLGINALGAFVHTSRLQYIEFFGKFYEDGGEEFTPLQKNTKYVKLTEENLEV